MNRHQKRIALQRIEELLIPAAERVVKLDLTIKALEEGITMIDETKDPETYKISTEKLHRLKMRSEVAGQEYDKLVLDHTTLAPEGGGIMALLESMKDNPPDADNSKPESLPH